MKRSIITVFITAAIVAAAGFGVRAYLQSKTPKVTTVAAHRGPITQIVSETGKIVASDDLTLSFKQSGRVAKILVKEGDAVKAGQALMQLDTASLEIQRKEAVAAQATAEAKYQQALAGATKEQIQVAQTAIQNAQTALDAKTSALDDLKASDARTLDGDYTALEGAIESLYVKANAAMQTLRSDLFDAQGNLTTDIRVTDSGAQTDASNRFAAAQAALAKMDTKIILFRAAASHDQEDTLASELVADGKVVRDAVGSATLLMQTAIPINITQAAFSTRQTEIKTAWADVGAGVSAADADQSAIATTNAAQTSAENAAQKQVETAQGALANANDQMAQLTAPLRGVDKDVYLSGVASARAGVQLIDQEISDATLSAPDDGVVGSIDISLGEVAQANAPVGTLVSSKLEIESEVSELDIADIKPGQTAEVTFDALEGQTFIAHVLTVAPREITKNEDIYYKVKATIDSEYDGIRIGMTANMDITTGHKDDALLVPRRQVYRSGGSDYVKIQAADGSVKETEVTVGLRGLDDDEILAGVQEGDRIVVE